MAESKSEQQMLGQNQMIYTRQYSIKDLYHANGIIDCFGEVEYESIFAYSVAIKNGMTKFRNKATVININDLTEFNTLQEIINKSNLTILTNLSIRINQDLLKPLINSDFVQNLGTKRFGIIVKNPIDLISLEDFVGANNRNWCENNPLWLEFEITYQNYATILRQMPYFYVKGGIRFFRLKFNYISFKDMKIEELPKLEFWIDHFMCWYSEKFSDPSRRIEFYNYSLDTKPLFVSKDMKLYYNEFHFKTNPNDFLIDLIETKDLNGETITFKKLNNLRQYMDLPMTALFFDFNIKKAVNSFIDYYQNKVIQGHVNEIPMITTIIMNYFGSLM